MAREDAELRGILARLSRKARGNVKPKDFFLVGVLEHDALSTCALALHPKSTSCQCLRGFITTDSPPAPNTSPSLSPSPSRICLYPDHPRPKFQAQTLPPATSSRPRDYPLVSRLALIRTFRLLPLHYISPEPDPYQRQNHTAPSCTSLAKWLASRSCCLDRHRNTSFFLRPPPLQLHRPLGRNLHRGFSNPPRTGLSTVAFCRLLHPTFCHQAASRAIVERPDP
jgi:hypothetical protein